MVKSHVIGYGKDEQFRYFKSVYGNYVKYFDYLITEENKHDILEQIRHGDNTVNAVVIMFEGTDTLNLDFTEYYSKVNFINLFDIEKLTMTRLV